MSDNNEGIISRHLKEFSLGTFLGGAVSGAKLMLTATGWTHLIGEWAIRLLCTSLIALCSGLATAFAKDLYEKYKAKRSLKTNKNEQRKEKDRAA